MPNYKVSLQAKNEGLSYEDESGIYRFNLTRKNKTWIVHLPPTKGNNFVIHYLSNQEQELLYPRISKYLSRIWWFGVWPVNYEVQFGL